MTDHVLELADLPMFWQGRANAFSLLAQKQGQSGEATLMQAKVYEECARELRTAIRSHPAIGTPDDAREALKYACDLLAERKYDSPARSPGHNARLVIERVLVRLAAVKPEQLHLAEEALQRQATTKPDIERLANDLVNAGESEYAIQPEQVAKPVAWRPIETAPKPNASVLLWYPWMAAPRNEAPAGFVYIARWAGTDDSEDCWRDPVDFEPIGDGPTHWMPLPAPPSDSPGSATP